MQTSIFPGSTFPSHDWRNTMPKAEVMNTGGAKKRSTTLLPRGGGAQVRFSTFWKCQTESEFTIVPISGFSPIAPGPAEHPHEPARFFIKNRFA